MKKIYRYMIMASIIVAPTLEITSREKNSAQDSEFCYKKPEEQQSFIADNGEIGIYQPRKNKAFIGDDSYSKVKALLPSKRQPLGTVSLGELIQGENCYKLYGKYNDPAPVNNGPDSDVRTEIRIDEDFLRNFGSGKYTTDDKWD